MERGVSSAIMRGRRKSRVALVMRADSECLVTTEVLPREVSSSGCVVTT